jgi:protein transport protein SEC23
LTIAQWRREGFQDDPKYEHLRQLLAAPKDDAQLILKERFPYPRYVECDQGSSQVISPSPLLSPPSLPSPPHQARFVTASIDPASTHNELSGGKGEVIFTDDVSLRVFMEHLKKLAVAPQ